MNWLALCGIDPYSHYITFVVYRNEVLNLVNYDAHHAPPSTSTPEASTVSTKRPLPSTSTNRTSRGYVRARTAQDRGLQKKDVEYYLAEACEDVLLENFDVLGW